MQKAKIVRLVAVLAMMLGAFSFMASPASAQGTVTGIGAPCQVQEPGQLADQANDDQECANIIAAALPAGFVLEGDGEGTFNLIDANGATVQQGACPGNIIIEGTIIQFTCGTGAVTPTPVTPTPVTPTPVTPTPVTPTPVTPTATVTETPVTPTATATATATTTATATATSTATATATVPGDDDDDDSTPTATATATTPADDDDSDAPVQELPSTGQGPTQNDSGLMALALGAASVLLAGVAFVWQRRGNEV